MTMGQPITCDQALIEILNLCEQTLTALRRYEEEFNSPSKADKFSLPRRQKRAISAPRFVLIQGGLSTDTKQSGAV